MRRPENLSNYTVEVSSTAWKQLSHLPLETYQHIRAELDSLATRVGTPTPAPLPPKDIVPSVTRSIVLEGYVAHYNVDRERRRLTLLEVARRPPQDP
jgi:mRNA-degrading endonuclease RelE of RelBE toxin-antitoxin system